MKVSLDGVTSPVEEQPLFARYSHEVSPWNSRRNGFSEFLDDTDSSGDDTTYVCEDCTLGSYNSQQNAASCTTCPKGYFAITNKERDKCDACTRGHFGTETGAVSENQGCKKCLKGSFSNDEGMEHCTNCPKGRYGDETGLSKESLCKNCDAGKIGSSKTGANASTSCQDCSTGRYNKNVGEFLSSSCKSCPKGKYL